MATNETSVDGLIERLYQTEEVVALASIQDRNKFHTEDNVLEHTRSVEANIQKALTFDFVRDDAARSRLNDYVSERVGNFTRAELLRVSGVLHDVGKAMTYVTEDGTTTPVMMIKDNGDNTSPKHAEVGAEAANNVLSTMSGMTEADVSYVVNVVGNHMKVFSLHDALAQTKKKDKIFGKVVGKLGDSYIDVLIHTRADLQSSQRRGDYEAKPLQFRGQEYGSDVEFVTGLIADSMVVKEMSGKVQGLEKASQQGKVYLSSESKGDVKEGLTAIYTKQMQPKVDAGHIPAKALPNIVGKRVSGLMQKLNFSDEIPSDYKTVLKEQPIAYSLE